MLWNHQLTAVQQVRIHVVINSVDGLEVLAVG